MRRPIPLQITIPEPCSEAWNEMQPVDSGRHCDNCQKTVVDFTRMTDAALLEYVQWNGLDCGMFRNEQLDRVILPLPKTKGKNWMLRLAASLLLMVGWNKEGVAQKKSKPHTSQNPSDKNHDEAEKQDENKSLTTPNKSVKSVPGFVDGVAMDSYGNPLISAVVIVSDTTGSLLGNALTDYDGVFRIALMDRNYVGKTVNINITYPGVKQVSTIKLVAGHNVVRMTIAKPPVNSLVQTRKGVIRPLVDFPKTHSIKRPLPSERHLMGSVNLADMAGLTSFDYLGRNDSVVSLGGGRTTDTVYIVDGATLGRSPKSIWRRPQFWKK